MNSGEKIIVVDKNFLRDENVVLKISEFQRPYVWKFNDVKKLFESLNEGVFIGVGICETGKDPSKKEYEIIDGQQRLISLALLLSWGKNSRLQKYLDYELDSDKENTPIKFKFQFDKHNDILNKILRGTYLEKSSIETDIIDNSAYVKFILKLKEKVLKFYLKKIQKDRQHFVKYLNDLKNKILMCLINISSLSKNHKSKFLLPDTFIKMNETGQKVEAHDIFKAKLIKKYYGDSAKKKKIQDLWMKVIDKYYKIYIIYSNVKLRLIFVQFLNATLGKNKENKNCGLKLGKYENPSIRISENILNIDYCTLEDFPDFISWYYKLFKMKKEMKNYETWYLGALDINDSIQISSVSLAYNIYKSKLSGDKKSILYFLLHYINTIVKENPALEKIHKINCAKCSKIFNSSNFDSNQENIFFEVLHILQKFYNQNISNYNFLDVHHLNKHFIFYKSPSEHNLIKDRKRTNDIRLLIFFNSMFMNKRKFKFIKKRNESYNKKPEWEKNIALMNKISKIISDNESKKESKNYYSVEHILTWNDINILRETINEELEDMIKDVDIHLYSIRGKNIEVNISSSKIDNLKLTDDNKKEIKNVFEKYSKDFSNYKVTTLKSNKNNSDVLNDWINNIFNLDILHAGTNRFLKNGPIIKKIKKLEDYQNEGKHAKVIHPIFKIDPSKFSYSNFKVISQFIANPFSITAYSKNTDSDN